MSDLCPVYAPFFSAMGCTSAIAFTCECLYGTAKSGVGVAAMSVLRPDQMMKCVVPVVMAGIIAIYGLVVSVLIASDLSVTMSLAQGFVQLGAGLSVGLAGLAAGFAIGIVGDAGVRGTAQQPRLFVGMILILIFAEVLGLYGLIVALIMNTKSQDMANVVRRVSSLFSFPVFVFRAFCFGRGVWWRRRWWWVARVSRRRPRRVAGAGALAHLIFLRLRDHAALPLPIPGRSYSTPPPALSIFLLPP
ncbi:hypothetical protein DFH08DRAFT_678566 [Mycena albidolilacea]|uniref:V-type proton ATPase proteolipid subunit n=1 Tax=Mycena albidolilacea TaxID=1033008 RepID=A0AAD7F4T7_9AGAR|nr:hypothetical protein DFH08DRAFT_678566 [Mycena albidolilacea]